VLGPGLDGIDERRDRGEDATAADGALWADRLSRTTWISGLGGDVPVDELQEPEEVGGGVALLGVVEDFAGGHVRRGGQVAVPCHRTGQR
jgi:hypothetical protein